MIGPGQPAPEGGVKENDLRPDEGATPRVPVPMMAFHEGEPVVPYTDSDDEEEEVATPRETQAFSHQRTRSAPAHIEYKSSGSASQDYAMKAEEEDDIYMASPKTSSNRSDTSMGGVRDTDD